MHCSMWTYHGDPDALERQYEAMVAEIPIGAMRFALCIKLPDGIMIVDTCPSKEVFDDFAASDGLRELLVRHGLDAPTSLVDHPVIAAFAGGQRVEA